MKNWSIGIGIVVAMISVISFFGGIIRGCNNLQAETAATAGRVDKIENKIQELEKEGSTELEAIKKDTVQLDKNLGEIKIEQSYTKEKVEQVAEKTDKIYELLLKQAEEKPERRRER